MVEYAVLDGLRIIYRGCAQEIAGKFGTIRSTVNNRALDHKPYKKRFTVRKIEEITDKGEQAETERTARYVRAHVEMYGNTVLGRKTEREVFAVLCELKKAGRNVSARKITNGADWHWLLTEER